jgi:steroid delta-isomerase
MIKTMMKQLLATIQADVSPEQITSAVHAYLDSWRAGDTQARAALFADHAVVEDPVGGPAIEGKDAIVAFWQGVTAYPTTYTPALESIVVCGNEAMVKFSLTINVTDLGSGTVHILENFVLDSTGKIVRLRAFWDENTVS